MRNQGWNNPVTTKTATIFQQLRESAITSSIDSLFKKGVNYSFDGDSFLGFIDVANESLVVSKNEDSFAEQMSACKESHIITSGDTFQFVSETVAAYKFKTASNESFSILKNSSIVSNVIEKKMEVGSMGKDLITGNDVGGEDLPGDELLGKSGKPEVDAGEGTLGKDALEKDAATGSGSAGEFGDDPIGGKKEGGEDLSGDELLGNHGKPAVPVGKLGGDPLTSKKEGVEMDKEEEEDVEDVEKDDKVEKDKKDREKNKDDKDADKDDKKEKDKKEKDDKDADKDDKKEMEEAMKEDDKKDSPENDKKDKKASKDDDEDEAEEEDEEVDEAASLFLQKLGSSLIRSLISEMSSDTGKSKFKNEDFIFEIAKKVARIERNSSSILPKTVESKLVYPTTESSIKFTDLVIFESKEGTFIVDQYNKNTVYKIMNSDVIPSLIKEGVTPMIEGLVKVDSKITFKVESTEYSFN